MASDWIEGYLRFTAGTPTPDLFRLWSGITTLASSLERRCWVVTAGKILFPNLFTLLVGPPASGKTIAIDPAKEILMDAQKFKLAPDNMTKAALVDVLENANGFVTTPEGIIEQHPLSVYISELGVFLPQHDLEFLGVLNYIYDNPPSYREQRRHSNAGKEKQIIKPQLNILAGAQPSFLASLLPEEAWGMGFTSRLIMIYSNSAPKTSLFAERDPQRPLKETLVKRLVELSQLRGQFKFERSAAELLQNWHNEGCPPVPEHYKLQHYNGRRIIHTLKLCMIAAVSEGASDLVIKHEHVQRAMEWLVHAEALMPDVFNDMTLKSDAQVIQELHFFMWKEFQRSKRPMHEARIIQFLSSRIPSEKILRVIEIAERSNVIHRQVSTKLYIPRAAGQIENPEGSESPTDSESPESLH